MAVGALVVELAATTVERWLRERSQLPPQGEPGPQLGPDLLFHQVTLIFPRLSFYLRPLSF